jgi:hypothetical protein
MLGLWLTQVPDTSLERGILPNVLRALILKRREVKKLMKTEKDQAKLMDYEIRQKVGRSLCVTVMGIASIMLPHS